MNNLEIIDFVPAYRDHFRSLNYEWLEKYFSIGETDERILNDPEGIIAAGGRVFFVLSGNEVIGTAAMVWYTGKWLELIKMAVAGTHQNRNAGKKLLQHCIDEARTMNAEALVLETAEILQPAIHLYENAGFRREKLPKPHYDYGRDVFAMKLDLLNPNLKDNP